MRGVLAAPSLIVLLALTGCAQNPYMLQSQLNAAQEQQRQLAQRNQELQSRASTLDQNNQELETLLAQTRQQTQRMTDHVAALQEQLRSSTQQVAQLRDEKRLTDEKAQTLVASTRRRAGAEITANRSLDRGLPALNMPGVEARQDGDTIRIELPADRLFDPATPRLRQGGHMLIDAVAAELLRLYPDQMIGIEGHSDNDPASAGQWMNGHQISSARALTIYEYLTTRSGFRPEQISVIGQGPNHPLVSNATEPGRMRNRRIEIVVYPERRRG